MTQDRFWILLAKKFSTEATKSELIELEELMRLYPELISSAQHIQNIWEIPAKDNNQEAKEAFINHISRMSNAAIDISAWQKQKTDNSIEIKSEEPFYKKRWFPWLTAACIVAIIATLFTKNIFTKQQITGDSLVNEVTTHNGSKSKIVLPDGSTVWLNADSKLTYEKDFGEVGRHVTLEGEAFFDVKKIPGVPFIIQTKVIHVKVLGTAFNIKSYSNEPTTETSLVRGQVEITVNKRPGDKYILLPNNKLVVANETEEEKKNSIKKEGKKIPLVSLQELTYYERDSTIIETSWKENRLVFQDESFADIASKLERWYNVKLVFSDKSLEAERLTGSFTDETIFQALEALQITTDFHFKIEQNKILLTR
jgi:ferric-dicitrate binding protein FerR (iron transport regulator)